MSKVISYNQRWLPSPPVAERKHCYLVVLTVGDNGDYAAYAGIIYSLGSIDRYHTDFVARHGDKISEKEARCHFFLPEKINYRE